MPLAIFRLGPGLGDHFFVRAAQNSAVSSSQINEKSLQRKEKTEDRVFWAVRPCAGVTFAAKK